MRYSQTGGGCVATDPVIARFIVDVDQDWHVTLTSERDDAGFHANPDVQSFTLNKVADPAGGFFPASPYPLHDPNQHATAPQEPASVESIKAAYLSIVDRTDPQVAAFGHYLYDALLGDRWRAMLAHAAHVEAKIVELALAFNDVADLSRLHWEMLHGGANFLAAGAPNGMRVAITRLVGPEGIRDHPQLRTPPRVLFVIGTSLSDKKVRPGAELMGLLRRLKTQRAVNRRLLEQASPTAIRDAVTSFEPDIVHIISHGDEREGRPFLILNVKDESGATIETPQYAEQLGVVLRGREGQHPTIAVLSACRTGGSSGGERYVLAGTQANVPLAEALVRGGVPIVVGMSGQITDLTCRLFTRQFGEALIDGEQLVAAIAEARTAAFLESPDLLTKPDWALPTLFLDRTLPSDFRPVPQSNGDTTWDRIDGWINNAELRRDPVFCGRTEFFPDFQGLFARGIGSGLEPRVFGVFAREEGFGRSRLLRELAIQAVLDGHIPILISRESREPVGIRGVADLLELAITRSKFRASRSGSMQLSRLLRLVDGYPGDKLDADIQEEFDRARSTLTPYAVRIAVQRDLAAFREDVHNEHEYFQASDALVVVLIDKVDTFGMEGVRALFLDDGSGAGRLLGPLGFGDADIPIPVVVSFLLGGATNEVLKDVSEATEKWMTTRELEEFTDDQATLAYQWVLLNPFREFVGNRTLSEVAAKGWALNLDRPEMVQKWDPNFLDSFQRRPGRLDSDNFFQAVLYAKRDDPSPLIPADDAAAIAKVRGTA